MNMVKKLPNVESIRPNAHGTPVYALLLNPMLNGMMLKQSFQQNDNANIKTRSKRKL